MPTGHDHEKSGLELNLRLIPVHEALSHSAAWIPVFVLFTRSRFDLDGAILAASLYYLFVVLLEVPSGWMSDSLGRVITLRIAALGFLGAHLCFGFGDDRFGVIILGQFMMALGYASLSGTDVTFHYGTLEALGQASSYGDRQARVASIGYGFSSASALLGGLLGLLDIRLAFLASGMIALAQFALTLRLVEPPSITHAEAFTSQIGLCLRYLNSRFLGWLFFYGIILVTLEHVVFTVMQPWLTEALGHSADDLGSTPLLAGALFGVISLVGSMAARLSDRVSRSIGVKTTLVVLAASAAVVISAMSIGTHLILLLLLVFRSVPGAAAPVTISTAVAPRIERHHRATFLSLNSLAGRLGYGLVLLTVSARASDDVLGVLRSLARLSWVLVAVLVVTALWARGSQQDRLSTN